MLLRRDVDQELNEHIDMTPMVDVVFQLMTFMLFSVQMTGGEKVDVPPARHGVGVEETAATFLTLTKPAGPGGETQLLLGHGEGAGGDARAGAPGGRRRRQRGAPQGDSPGRRRCSARRGRQGRRRGRSGRGDHGPCRRSGTAGPLAGVAPGPDREHRTEGLLANWDVFHGDRLELERGLSTSAIREALARGELRDDDLVRPAGTTVAWARLADMPELLDRQPPRSATRSFCSTADRQRRCRCRRAVADGRAGRLRDSGGGFDGPKSGPGTTGARRRLHRTGSSTAPDPTTSPSRSSTTTRPKAARCGKTKRP